MTLGQLHLLAVSTLGLALATLAYAVGSAPVPPPERLGLRGYKRTSALRDSAPFSLFEPTMRYIGRRVHGLLSPELRARLEKQLTLTGNLAGLRPEEVVALAIMCAVSLGTLGGVYGYHRDGALFFGPLLGVLGAIAPSLYLASVAQERLRQIALSTPQIVDLLALSLGAGLDFPGALRQIVDRAVQCPDALHEELQLVLQDLSIGRTRRRALSDLAVRAPCEPIRDLVSAVTQAEEQGTPLAEVLRIQAHMARLRRTTRAEESAAKAATSMLLPLVLLFVSVLILIIGPMMLRLKEQLA
ncbi:MAG: type II secretion system F family protein [Myxococcales bacterium]|nr:type II secretion system F family protein [Myxococcales bacterium]MDD9966650.1 type II secretion system F family protein [Myxococcales bacterium]